MMMMMLLNMDDQVALKKLSWHGIPAELRSTVWPVLIGYLPPASPERRALTLQRKRAEYQNIVRKYFPDDQPSKERDPDIYHQICIDVPRTCPDVPLFKDVRIRAIMTRILYCWSIRRPASSYVQGINDVLSPFIYVLFQSVHAPKVEDHGGNGAEGRDGKEAEDFDGREADCFWCFSTFIDVIQDHYVVNQPGIYRQLALLKELVARIDPGLAAHFAEHQLDIQQFAFRWMNCLLQREFRLPLVVRLFDTYLSADSLMHDLAVSHTFTCAALLARLAPKLIMLSDFGDLLMLLQNVPTHAWTEDDLATLISEAYVLRSLYGDTVGRSLPYANSHRRPSPVGSLNASSPSLNASNKSL